MKRLLLAVALVLAVVRPASAQLALHAGSPTSSGEQQATNPYSFSVTISAGEIVLCGNSAHRGAGLTDTVTSIVWNTSETLTSVRTDAHASARPLTGWWVLKNPTAGTHNITVTLSAAIDNLTVCYVLSGADTTTPTDANGGTSGTSTTASQSVTTVTDNAWTFAVLNVTSNNTITIVGGDTQDSNVGFGIVNGQAAFSHFGPKTPAGSKTMSWTLSPSDGWAESLVAIKPAGGGGGSPMPPSNLTILGVGPGQ